MSRPRPQSKGHPSCQIIVPYCQIAFPAIAAPPGLSFYRFEAKRLHDSKPKKFTDGLILRGLLV